MDRSRARLRRLPDVRRLFDAEGNKRFRTWQVKMGGALLEYWKKGEEKFTIVDPFLESAPEGVDLVKEKADLGQQRFDVIIVAIKPQMIDDILPDYAPVLAEGGYVISMAAGASIARRAAPTGLPPRASRTPPPPRSSSRPGTAASQRRPERSRWPLIPGPGR